MASNKRRRHTPDQIIRKLAEGNKLLAAGQELGEVCRQLEIAESTWHRWLAQYGGMKANEAKRLKELEAENARLKKLVANQAAGHRHAQGDLGGKLLTPNRKPAPSRRCVSGSGYLSAGPARSSVCIAPRCDCNRPGHHRGGRATGLAAQVLHRPASLGVAAGSQDGP